MKLHILLTSFFFFLPHFIATNPVASKFRIIRLYCIKDVGNYTTDSPFQKNLNALLVGHQEQALLTGFGSRSKGPDGEEVYTLYNCRGDLNHDECHNCIKEAAQRLVSTCRTEMEGIIWYEQCMLRYANRNIQSRKEENPYTWDTDYSKNVSNPQEFGEVLAETIDGLIEQAAYNETAQGYAIGETDTTGIESFDKVYSFAQCTPDILGRKCERCLRVAFATIGGCCGINLRMFQLYFPSCIVRYDPSPFINGTGERRLVSPFPLDKSLQPPSPTSSGTVTLLERDNFIFGIVLAVSTLLIFAPTSN